MQQAVQLHCFITTWRHHCANIFCKTWRQSTNKRAR